jgi:hypothetical protein
MLSSIDIYRYGENKQPTKSGEVHIEKRNDNGEQKNEGCRNRVDKLASPLFLIKIGIDEAVISGGIPPNDRREDAREHQNECVENCHRLIRVFADN